MRLFLHFGYLVLFSILSKNNAKVIEKEWWQNANFYQVYPRSFKDMNNDGEGDLEGVRQKLPYLRSIGVENIWLSPIFSSPMVDSGYDISDYRDINPIFGTMKNFDNLLQEAHNLGMKVVLDLVPNHTSEQHVWFYKSMLRIPGFEDFYVWADGKEEILPNGTIVRQPPNNWISVSSYSAWTWNEIRGQYYFRQFASEQPDLNFWNPKVVEEIKNVMRFWLDKGVDGFRVDAVPHIFESKNFEDEPSTGIGVPGVDWTSLDHIYTKDLNETFDLVYQMRAVCDEYTDSPRVIMLESYTTLENTFRYYGNETTKGASFSFNFLLMSLLNTSTAIDFEKIINEWLDAIDPKYTSNWVLGNHDNKRVATRHGIGRVDGLNMLVNFLPGVGITYNGEEFGLEDGFVSWEDSQDPNALNAGPDHYLEITRDPERTPFHWDNSTNAGFNEGAKPWLPVSEKYLENNVAFQEVTEKSHLTVFKEVMALRKLETLREGDTTVTAANEDVLLVARELSDVNIYVLILNLNGNARTINLQNHLTKQTFSSTATVKMSSSNSTFNKGDEIVTRKPLTIEAHTSLILEYTLS